tara:strand:+ start:1598 stop:2881 length:1284 start_codon:yes stop_codon:yes gene_type:complete
MNIPSTPLAERLRPQSLKEYVGQIHLVGNESILRKSIENKIVPSLILWGPPGVGKTTLANIIAKELQKPFYTLSAINSGVKEVREVINKAEQQQLFGKGQPILFIDEIHRFSKSQQDSLLGAVEKGTITLIGATTENPSFEVISALLSRCQVYTLKSLDKKQLKELIEHAISTDKLLQKYTIRLDEKDALIGYSGGDARKLLNTLELVILSVGKQEVTITNELVKSILQRSGTRYDKNGENHYDVISAFIKSIRGSDPNGAIFWLAKMIEGGEDPKFIARRLIISASEDIGNANPTALVIATNCFQAVSMIGFPEAEIILAQATTYLASSAKSNASYLSIKHARQLLKQMDHYEVPLHLRNAPTKLMKELDYGKEYKYSHDYPNNFVEQEYLPQELSGTVFYDPGKNPREDQLRNWLKARWKDKYNY